MTDTASIDLDATEVWQILRTLEQALEILHEELDDDAKGDPISDPVYRRYFELYERFKSLAALLPEPDLEFALGDDEDLESDEQPEIDEDESPDET